MSRSSTPSRRSWVRRLFGWGQTRTVRRPRRPALGAEALEHRVLLAQLVELGAIALFGDFTQNGDTYSGTEQVRVGFSPTGNAAFTPLIDINPDAGGSVTFTVGTPNPAFTVSDAAVAAAQGSLGLPLWHTADTFTFTVADLTGRGVPLTSGGQPFAVAGGTFTLDSLAFNPGPGGTDGSEVRLQGSLVVAPFTSLNLAVSGTEFVNINSSGTVLTGVSGPVTGSLSVGGLAFDTAGLVAAYDAAGDQFVLSGASSFKLEGTNTGVTFAGPGIVFADGVVQEVEVALASDLAVGGLRFTTGQLTLTFDGNQTFSATGQSSVTVAGAPLGVALGGGTTSGLVVTGGALTNLDLTTTGILMLQELEVQAGDAADPLTIAYTPGSGTYTLTGTVTIETLFGATATLGQSGQDVLTVRNGVFDFVDFNLGLSNVNLGAFTITTLMVAFTPDSFTATLNLMFPGNWQVGGTIGFLDGKLNDIGLSLPNASEIPIADTGILITGFSAEVQNLENPADLVVSGSLTAAWGSDELISATGGFTVSREELVLDANVTIGDNLSTATGTLTLDWGNRNYELDVDAIWLNGLFTFEAVIDLSDGDELYVKGEADLNVPRLIPFFGGDRLGSVDFVLEYFGGKPRADSFVAGWVDFLDLFEIGVKADFAGDEPSVIGSSQIQQIDAPPPTNPARQTYHYDIPFTVPASASAATLQVVWPDEGGTQSVEVVVPNGPTVPQSQFSPANGFSVLPQLTSNTAIAVGAVNPAGQYVPLAPGNYTLRLVSNRQFGAAPRLTASYGHAPPTAAVANPPAFPAGPVAVSASGKVSTALGANARATFFYDGDGSGYHGTAIDRARDLPLTVDADGNWTASGVWDTDGLLPLPHFVYARIDDSVNGPVYSAYSAAVTPTPALSGLVTDPTNSQALSGIRVYVDADDNGRFDPGTDPSTTTGPTGFYAFAASQLPQAGPFFVGAIVAPGFRLHPGSVNPARVTYGGTPLGVNFELDQFASIQGQVYSDLPAGRVGLSGWTVYLDADGDGVRGAGELSSLTNSSGQYAFRNVTLDSTQTVRVELMDGFFQTAPPFPGSLTVEVGPDRFRVYGGNDFGVLPFSTISGTVTGHQLKDGVLDPATVPLEGVTVALQLPDGTTLETNSDVNGGYSFGFLRPGTYVVEQVVPAGFRQVTPFGGVLRLGDPVGSHTWQLPNQFAADVVVADFNGNGRLDTAVLGFTIQPLSGSFPSTVWVYYDGDFTNPVSLNPGGPNPSPLPAAILAADVFGGSGSDLVFLFSDGTVTVLPSRGGALQNGEPFQALPGAGNDNVGHEGLVQGTFYDGVNGPQFAAMYVEGNNSGIVTFHQSGTPLVAVTVPGQTVGRPAAGDVNGDGTTDLFLYLGQPGSPVVYYGDGNGGFTPVTINSLPAGEADSPVVVMGDVNGDGRLDLGVFDDDGQFHYALQDGAGGFGQSFAPGVGVPAGVSEAALRDMNGDFRPDLVWTVNDATVTPLIVSLNTGMSGAWFTQQTQFPLHPPFSQGDNLAFAVGDLDGDGLEDLVVLDFSFGLVQRVTNMSTIAPAPINLQIQGGQNPSGIDFVDVHLGQLSGRVFDDVSRDGRYSAGKPGRAGVTVYLDLDRDGRLDAREPTSVTVTGGHYAFTGLRPTRRGQAYHIRWVDEPGRRPTTPDGGVHRVTLSNPGATVAGLDFGNAVKHDVVLTLPTKGGTGDWTVLVNRGRLEVLDRDLGVVDSRPLAEVFSLTVVGAARRANRLTVDLAAGGFFAPAGGISFVGSGADDGLQLRLGDGDDVVTVDGTTAAVNGRLRVSWSGLERLAVDAGGGDDAVAVTGRQPARGVVILTGGAGDDVLTAGRGPNLLLGGAGDDVLIAGQGRNLLVGGAGRDRLLAARRSGGDSILVGGGTVHDGDERALGALMAEWASGRSLRQRVANLTDGSGSRRRLNGDSFLAAGDLVDDGAADDLVGDSRRDWFRALTGDPVVDLRPGRRRGP